MRKMKDSRIPWVGMIPCCWEVKPNKYVMHKIKEIQNVYNDEDVLSLSMDGVKVRDLEAGGKMPSSFDGYQIVKIGNLLMCLFDMDVTPRCIGIVRHSGVTSPAYSQFELYEGNCANYFYYYYLALDNDKILVHLAKNLRHSLTEEQLGTISIPVPPHAEQERIAVYLDSVTAKIDHAIEEAKELIEAYKKFKRSVISEAVTKGLDRNAKMKDSGKDWIGAIPEHWYVKRLGYFAWVRARLGWRGLKADEYVEDGFAFLSAFNIVNDKMKWESVNYITKERYDESPEIKLQRGDILFVKDGAGIGKCARIDELPLGETTANGSLAFITPISDVQYKYLHYYLVSGSFQLYMKLLLTGMGVPHFTQSEIRKIKIPVPPLSEQEQIADYLDCKCAVIDKMIEKKESIIEELQRYRKSVIYEYVTGKKQVAE